MENKEIKKPIPEELSDEDLNLVAGGYQDFRVMDDLTETPIAMKTAFAADEPIFQAVPSVEIAR